MFTPGSCPPHPVMLFLYLATVQLQWSSWGVVPGSRTPQHEGGECFSFAFPTQIFSDILCSQTWRPSGHEPASHSFFILPKILLLYLMLCLDILGGISTQFIAFEPDLLLNKLSFSDSLCTEYRNPALTVPSCCSPTNYFCL